MYWYSVIIYHRDSGNMQRRFSFILFDDINDDMWLAHSVYHIVVQFLKSSTVV